MRITFTNDTEPGWAQLRCAEEQFPEAPLRLSLQRARDHRFLGPDNKWYTRPEYLDVAQVRAGGDLVLLLPPKIVSQLDTCAHRVGLLAPDDTLFKGQVMIRNPRYTENPPEPDPAVEQRLADRIRQEAGEASAPPVRPVSASAPASAPSVARASVPAASAVAQDPDIGAIRAERAAGVDVTKEPDDEATRFLLLAAAPNDNPQVLAALQAAGADVNARDEDGKTALMQAPPPNDTPAHPEEEEDAPLVAVAPPGASLVAIAPEDAPLVNRDPWRRTEDGD